MSNNRAGVRVRTSTAALASGAGEDDVGISTNGGFAAFALATPGQVDCETESRPGLAMRVKGIFLRPARSILTSGSGGP
jgi:hypothetical protein